MVERSQALAKNWAEPERCRTVGQLQRRLNQEDRLQRELRQETLTRQQRRQREQQEATRLLEEYQALLEKQAAGEALRYTYRILFIPETIGAISWLAQNREQVAKIKHGLVATCLGDPGPPRLRRR